MQITGVLVKFLICHSFLLSLDKELADLSLPLVFSPYSLFLSQVSQEIFRHTRPMSISVLGQNPPGQNPPDKIPWTKSPWTKSPLGQNPPRQNPPGQNAPIISFHYIPPNCSIAQYFLLYRNVIFEGQFSSTFVRCDIFCGHEVEKRS